MSNDRIPGFIRHLQRCALVMAGAVSLVLATGQAIAQDDPVQPHLKVVASFSILADMVRVVGGDYVEITTLVGRGGDVHAYEPSPADVRKLADADVLVRNGLDFEPWLPRLVSAAGFGGRTIVASEGVRPRRINTETHLAIVGADVTAAAMDAGVHHHGQLDPHAWQDLNNGKLYAKNIAAGLARADPFNAGYYYRRARSYMVQMTTLHDKLSAALKVIPPERRQVVTGHDAFGYFGEAYGIQFYSLAGLSTDSEPSARTIAALIDYARQNPHVGIFTEVNTHSGVMLQLAREACLRVGGPLYSDVLANIGEPAGTYLGVFHWNAGQLITVLGDRSSWAPSGPSD